MDYVDNEIYTYMTSNKMLAISDRLNLASVENYATIHAQHKDDKDASGRRIRSTFGILANDFSRGKGNLAVKAEANISPSEARFIMSQIENGIEKGVDKKGIFSSEKIFASGNGGQVRKLTIGWQTKDNKGEERKSPWVVSIENGTGTIKRTSSGGSFCEKNSYKRETHVLIYFTYQDIYKMFVSVIAFLNVWEMAYGCKLLKEGHALLQQKKQERAANPPKNPPAPPVEKQKSTEQPNMSLEKARAVIISIGTHKGKTMGQLESENKNGLKWYVDMYKGNDENLRQAAAAILSEK